MAAKYCHLEHLVFALDHLGKTFAHNKILYYSLGTHLGFSTFSLICIELLHNPLSWILTASCVKAHSIPVFLRQLEQYFNRAGIINLYWDFLIQNKYCIITSDVYWESITD